MSPLIRQQQSLMLSPHIELYDLIIPKDNILRRINELVDFSFVYDELKENYCLDNGRNAIDPIRMFKYLLLKALFDLSDVDVVERSKPKTDIQKCIVHQIRNSLKYVSYKDYKAVAAGLKPIYKASTEEAAKAELD